MLYTVRDETEKGDATIYISVVPVCTFVTGTLLLRIFHKISFFVNKNYTGIIYLLPVFDLFVYVHTYPGTVPYIV